MGTNYYLKVKEDCPCCGRPYERLHIGKLSSGWAFLFAPNAEHKVASIKDWILLSADEGVTIEDEYGTVINKNEFWKLVRLVRDRRKLKDEGRYHIDWVFYEYLDEDGYRFAKNDFS